MLTRSATMNKIADAIDGLLLIAEISSSHAILRRSSSVSVSSKLESLHPTVGPAWSDFSPQDPLEPPPSPTRLPLRSSSSFAPSAARSRTKKAPKGVYGIRPDYIVSGDRETRIRDIKRRALNIPSTGNTPATEQQRLVMLMVFKEITPYPDEGWLSILAILVDREYHQVKNWFSNQRQKNSRTNRENTRHSLSPTTLVSTLRKVTCEGRVLRLRPSALECCPADDWSDQFFEEVVMVHNVKVLMRLRRSEAKLAMVFEAW